MSDHNRVDLSEEREGAYRSDDAGTSRDVAIKIKPMTGRQRVKVLWMFYCAGAEGRIDEQNEHEGITRSAASTRRHELLHTYDMVEPTGERRRTCQNNDAFVHRINARGRAWVEDNWEYVQEMVNTVEPSRATRPLDRTLMRAGEMARRCDATDWEVLDLALDLLEARLA